MNALVETIQAMKGLKEEDILEGERIRQSVEQISAVEPASELLNRTEPDFILGYDVDTDALWDAYVRGENILIVGPSGTGKSSLAYHLLDNANEGVRKRNRTNYDKNLALIKKGVKEEDLLQYKPIPYPVSYLGCGVGTRTESVIGTLKFRATESGREPYTVLGAVTEAWTTGKTLIIDEIDFASPDTWGELHQFFDGRTKETTVYINGPETIRKNPKFRVIATANTFGNGENQIDFAGTQILNSAFLNRFTYKIELNYLKPEKEVEAITTKYSAAWKEAVEKMVEAANRIREAKQSGTLTRAITTRDLLSWTRECIAKEKRLIKQSPRQSLRYYWDNVVVPSAGPSYLTGNPDSEVLGTYLELR